MRILITAGPTREFIDPVRFISNSSTGYFGYEIARAAVKRGHSVTLVSGPTGLKPPEGARFISVLNALQMKAVVDKFFPKSDCLIMTAAVADYRPAKFIGKKIKKSAARLTLKLTKNPDILLEAGRRKGKKVLVGFSLETIGPIKNAKYKLASKNLDLIVANRLDRVKSPFGARKTRIAILNRDGGIKRFFSSKKILSKIILDNIERVRYLYYLESQKKGGLDL